MIKTQAIQLVNNYIGILVFNKFKTCFICLIMNYSVTSEYQVKYYYFLDLVYEAYHIIDFQNTQT